MSHCASPGRATLLLAALLVCAGCTKKEAAAPVEAAPAAASGARHTPLPLPARARYVRDLYRTLADCAFDWGHAGRCRPLPAAAPELAQGANFFGPNYPDAIRDEAQLDARREALDQGYVQVLDETPSNRSLGTSDTPAS